MLRPHRAAFVVASRDLSPTPTALEIPSRDDASSTDNAITNNLIPTYPLTVFFSLSAVGVSSFQKDNVEARLSDGSANNPIQQVTSTSNRGSTKRTQGAPSNASPSIRSTSRSLEKLMCPLALTTIGRLTASVQTKATRSAD